MGATSSKPPVQYNVQCLKNQLSSGQLTFTNIYNATQKCYGKGDKNTSAFPPYASFFGAGSAKWSGSCLKSKFPKEVSITSTQIKNAMQPCLNKREGFSYTDDNHILILIGIAFIIYMIYSK